MSSPHHRRARTFGYVGLIWLCGVCLRLTVLAVPPLLPMLRAELHLSGTEIGLLGSLPIALFAVAALPGSLLIARLGAMATVGGGLALVALGSAGRGLGSAPALFAMTVAMGAGIAVTQPAIPVMIKQWLPDRVSFATAVYTNGLLMGTVPPVWLTLPFVLPLLGNSWRLSFVAWSAPVALTALLAFAVMRRSAPGSTGDTAKRPWWPDWSRGLYWRLGILFGASNSLYFGTNTFIPGHLAGIGHPELIGDALTAFNLGALPGSFLLFRLARPLERRALPYLVLGLLFIVGDIGLVSTTSAWLYGWAALLGFGQGASLMLGLALPPLLSRPDDVARTSAAMFTISYALAGLIGIAGGVAWDLTGIATAAFVPIGCSGVIMVACAVILRRTGELR
jgi:CP family cyanate transporter-like MFS transporter